MNKIMLVGRLTKDLEMSLIGQGTPKGKATVAVERRYQKDYNNKISDFFNLEIIGQGIDKREHLFTKGILVSVEGELNQNEYQGKYYTTVVVHNIQPLELKKKEKGFIEEESDDIPF